MNLRRRNASSVIMAILLVLALAPAMTAAAAAKVSDVGVAKDPRTLVSDMPKLPADAGKGKKVGIVLMHAGIEWFKTIQQGAEDAAKMFGVDKLYVSNAEYSVDGEAREVDNLVALKVDAIILSAMDTKASLPAMQRAADAGIVIINYNTNVDSPLMKTYVGTDNTELGAQGGRAVVDYVTKKLGGKAKIALMTIPKFAVGVQRREGLGREIAKLPGIKVVAEQEGVQVDDSTSAVENIIQSNPDLNVIWCAAEGATTGATAAVKAAGKADKIKVYGTDMSLLQGDSLLDATNPLVAVSTQRPYEMGWLSVYGALAFIHKKPWPKEVIIPLGMYTKDKPKLVKDYLAQFAALRK